MQTINGRKGRFTISIPDDLINDIKRLAREDRRNTSQYVEIFLQQLVQSRKLLKQEVRND